MEQKKKAGYEYLIAYKITVPIYDLTTQFCNFFIDKLIASLKKKHMKEGGLTEELYRKRREYRGY